MAVTHMFDSPPPGVAADWTMPQRWQDFTAAEHATWDRLVARQSSGLRPYAARDFLTGLETLHLSDGGIPDFAELNPRLKASTGWEVVAVPGVIPNAPFFRHLSQKRFPAANFLRDASSLDYSEEPDMFHDLFGHLPMLTNPVFSEFLVAYGKAGLRAEALGAADFLGELWLYTVEFGLVAEGDGVRAFGGGLLSSFAETVHSVTSPAARRLRFDIARVMRTRHLFDEFQKVYFVIDSFEDLLRVTEETDFASLYRDLAGQPKIAPDQLVAGDVLYVHQTMGRSAL